MMKTIRRSKIAWDRNQYLRKYQRQFESYEVLETKSIRPRIDYKRWEHISAKVLSIGNFWDAWDWLTDNFYDADTIITGIKGSGKTSVGLRIAKDKAHQRNVSFTVDKDVYTGRIVILTPELIADSIVPYSVMFIDEIQHCFNRMRSVSSENIEANRFMDLKRKWKTNIVGTMPQITSAEAYLINEKFRFWINCYKNVKARQYVKTVVWVNLYARDGKYRDWVKLEERNFRWCDKRLYEAATKKWNREHSDVRNLESFKKKQLKIIQARERQKLNQQIRDIVSYNFLSLREKTYLLLDLDISKIKIESYLKRYIKERIKSDKATKEEEEAKINKNFIYECESDLDLDPDLIDKTNKKIMEKLKSSS